MTLLLFALMAVAACQTLPPPEDVSVLAEPADAGAGVPSTAPRFVVDPQASEIRLLVYREGPLARFGHNHVIVGHVRGDIHAGDAAGKSGFQLEIPVDSFEVDPPTARAEEGAEFAAEVSEQARTATRENMLGAEVLDAASHPFIRVESVALVGPRWNPTVTARVTLRGATRALRFPAAVFQQDDTLAVIATFGISQTHFGVQPFSVLGGGLQVRDTLDVRIRLVAHRAH
ncbi:MAG: YceI family protein [Betaproteobacteria bacterium]|nr:YceI family protein [Betaproteobacteria bacterium]